MMSDVAVLVNEITRRLWRIKHGGRWAPDGMPDAAIELGLVLSRVCGPCALLDIGSLSDADLELISRLCTEIEVLIPLWPREIPRAVLFNSRYNPELSADDSTDYPELIERTTP
jgi:hypothetical protein